MPELSIVIPVYRAEAMIDELTRQLLDAAGGITDDFEIIYVEDFGGDGSWERIQKLAAREPCIKGIKLCRNFGQHFALTAGLDASDGDWVVIMDCDLQDRPEEIARLLEKARDGYDVVLARRIGDADGMLNRATSGLFYRVFDYFTGTRTDPAVGAFRAMSRKVVETFRTMPERHRFFGGMIHWMGFKTASIDVPRSPRQSGTSSYSFGKRASMAVDAILSFSNKPLVIMVKVGMLVVTLSGAVALYIIALRLSGRMEETGYASLIVSIYFLSGVTLMSLGLVGIYVGRIYDQVKGRPIYIVERTTSDG